MCKYYDGDPDQMTDGAEDVIRIGFLAFVISSISSSAARDYSSNSHSVTIIATDRPSQPQIVIIAS